MDAIIDYRGKSPSKASFGIPLITAKIVKDGRILPADEFIPEEDYDAWMRRGFPHAGDIVMTTEAPLGEIAQIDARKVALAQRLIVLRGKAGVLDNTYLKFAMQSSFVQGQLRARSTGTTVLGIRQSELRRVVLPIPTVPEQKAIGHILGTLDDKIELNRRMNETLEAMARAIFKSWFVDFDPVRAKAEGRQPFGMDAATAALFPDSFEDSPLEKVPKGWVVKRLGNLADSIVERVDATPAKDEERYIALDDMPSRRIDLSTWRPGSEVNSSIVQFRKGDILFGAMRPYFHKVGLAQFPGITRTTTFVLRPKRGELRHFALLHFSSDGVVDHATTASVGTTIPYVRWDPLANYEIPLPPERILASFEQAATPLTELIALNGEQSRTLAALRDALLPKLISGEIRVEKAEGFA
jgi:type I restriction enzyme S subunit